MKTRTKTSSTATRGCRWSTRRWSPGTIANTNGLLVILAKLVAKGVFDRDDLKSFSDSYSKPLDHVGMRENELVSQMQDQMEATLAELMRYLERARFRPRLTSAA